MDLEDTDRCPRCGTDTTEIDEGPDSWDDDITWISYQCQNQECGLKYHGWHNQWEEDGEEWKP